MFIANINLILGYAILDTTLRALVVAFVMAILTPIMAAIGSTATRLRSRGVRPVGLNGIDVSSWQDDLVVSAIAPATSSS